MKANSIQPAAQSRRSDDKPPECAASENGIDISLLQESLTKTVWERMLANDDALLLADLLHTAMLNTRAKA